ncbi:MAG: peptidoglycan DD-metalloendopeptidase family protein [Candidatus Peregrinibacteria bacterium]
MSQESLIRWLALRVRLACVAAFAISLFVPPYAPKTAFAIQDMGGVSGQQFLLVEDGFLMKSSSLTQQGGRRAYSEAIVPTVKEGDSLERLSQRYRISKDTIVWANDLKEGETLHPGDEVVILPVDGVLHTVKAGQTLLGISELYDIPADLISQQNKLKGSFLMAGQELIIPEGKPIIAKKPIVAAAVSSKSAGKQTSSRPTVAVRPTPDMTTAPTSGVLQKPCSDNCFITQYFNPGHYALDLQEKGGGPVYAAEAGTVIRAENGWNGGFGNVIEIDHGNDLVTLYGHNKELYVKVGDTVKRGQLISWMGNTGLVYGATGIHTHFEVRVKGIKKNPMLYIEE